MEKTNMYNFDVLRNLDEKESQENRLGRLWATAAKTYNPVTTLQYEFHDMELEPYTDMLPGQAMAMFMKESRTYTRAKGPTRFFESQLRDHDITIKIDHIEINGAKHVPVGGSLVPMNATEITARECANIITQYTRIKGEKEKTIIAAAEPKDYRKVNMLVTKTTTLRQFLGNYNSDVMRARDEMYFKLSSRSSLAALIFCTSVIYDNEQLKPYCQESPELVAIYDKETKKLRSDAEKARKKAVTEKQKSSIIIPAFPSIKKAFKLRTGPFTYVMITSPESIWRFYLSSATVRGGQRKIGALTRGYYRFDISPPLIAEMEEATDVIMIVKKFKYEAVTLEIADIKLALILIRNGITVYCPALSPDVQRKKNQVGVYSRGDLKSFIYRMCTQDPPTLTKASIKMPDPIPINGNLPMYVVEHIPNAEQNGRFYLPSCQAAQGMCIKTNVNDTSMKGITLEKLRQRFCKALWYRNWFLVTRYTFVSQDPYAENWFNTQWVMPKIKEEIEENLFKDGTVHEIGNIADLQDIALSYREQDSVAEAEERNQTTQEEIDAIYSNVTLTYEEAVDVRDWAQAGKMPVDHKLFPVYQFCPKEDFLERMESWIDSLRDENYDSDENNPERKKIDQDDSSTDSEKEEEEDFFAGGEPRVVHPLNK
jgi:hypothetical protein